MGHNQIVVVTEIGSRDKIFTKRRPERKKHHRGIKMKID